MLEKGKEITGQSKTEMSASSSSANPSRDPDEPEVVTLTEDMDYPQALDSLCVSCGETGVTNFLPRIIPFFRSVIIAAFSCPHCGFRSSDLHTMSYDDRGIRYELEVTQRSDLDREVVRTEYATVSVPAIEFEIPFNPERKGEVTTVEGILTGAIRSIEEGQPLRKVFSCSYSSLS
jgi:zinc finger protein